MKLRHNTNGFVRDSTDHEWAARVEREAQVHTNRSKKAYERAQRRLARATARAEREARLRGRGHRKVADLWAVVERRREDLTRLERVMQATPAGSQHRGRGSYRGVS